MNDDDLLAKATRELREAGDPPLPELRQTRRRIMEASSRAEKPSRRWVWLVGQLAAFLLAATALAATTGQLQPMIEAVRVLVGAPSAAPEPAPVQPRPRGARLPAASAAPAALPPSAEADAVLPSEAAAEMPEGAGSALAARSVADDVAPALPRAAVTDPTRAAAAAPGHHVVARVARHVGLVPGWGRPRDRRLARAARRDRPRERPGPRAVPRGAPRALRAA
jgi:hypothetical protein